jgi:NCAIR mutase (PurE)-related protein
LKELLEKQIKLLKAGKISEKEFQRFFENFPYNNLGNIKLDFHRTFRRGLPEVIYGKDKNIDQGNCVEYLVNKGKELNINNQLRCK